MTLDDYLASTRQSHPPAGLTPPLLALWHDKRGDWDAAHGVAQDIDDATGSWIHAYLHREEGDLGNAAYWYRRAGRPVATASLDDEWREIVSALLG